MTLEWRPEGERNFVAETIEDMKKEKASKYVYRGERWCPICKNAETIIMKKKISQEFNKRYVQVVWDCIVKEKLQNFDCKTIKRILNIEHLSNGTLQNKALTVLSILGYIKKEIVVFKNEKGEEMMKYSFFKTPERKIPSCYNQVLDGHDLDWDKEGIKTRFFDATKPKPQEEEKEDDGDYDDN